jgi:23S rRNA pseudouridine2604 synthase
MRTNPQPNAKKKLPGTKKLPAGTKVRINKHMADIGLSSRREADEFIAKGVVFVNGTKATRGMQIDPSKDVVEMKGNKQGYVYYAYNKPIGIVTTLPQGDEEDILSSTKFHKKVFPVGRLDKDSHGLILLTNDRRITHRLLSPKFEHEKEYRVTIKGRLGGSFIRKLETGVIIDKVRTMPVKVFRENDHTFRIILTEGRNRQIRQMVEAAGDTVIDLMRLRIEHILLGDIKDGTFRNLSKDEISKLLKKLDLQ